jgi:mono/diheme cytochrome c family protein
MPTGRAPATMALPKDSKEHRVNDSKSRSAPTLISAVALAIAWLAACASSSGKDAAPTETPAGSSDARTLAEGQRLFRMSCASCHGTDARGKGPVAPILAVPVPDLTLIAARRGGSFPADDIYRIVDGQADLGAHGPRHMPVWGYELFGEDADDEAAHRAATEKIDSVVRFLHSVQRAQ